MNDKIKKGLVYALIASIISGISVFLNKYAVESVKSPILLVTAKNLLVGFTIVSGLMLMSKWSKVKKLSQSEVVKLVLIAIIGGSLPFYLFFTGLATVPAINAALIQKTLVLWVAVLAVPLLREKINHISVVAVGLIFLGNIYVGGFSGFQFSQGELMILLATILWAIESVISKKILKTVDVIIVAGYRMGLGSLLLLTAMVVTNPGSVSSLTTFTNVQISWIMITAILLIGYVLTWYRALSLAPVVMVSSVLVLATIITNTLSAVFVTHTWTAEMAVQTLLILGGITASYLSIRLTLKSESVATVKGQSY